MQTQDITIIQGNTFEWLILINDVNGSPLDMASYSGGTAGARGMVRKKYTDAAATATFTISRHNKTGVLAAVAAGTCHLTTADIAALQPDTAGSCYLLVRLTATQTAGMAKGSYVYDIEVEDPTGFVDKPFTGAFSVSPEATR